MSINCPSLPRASLDILITTQRATPHCPLPTNHCPLERKHYKKRYKYYSQNPNSLPLNGYVN
ncbi:protein of unknown function [Candidatus Promineifilum breve]|uniref:Uncharacterized protein n=1 Tax=Candidatus Promineifilum breve TaxID=1806508 RepID=A0A170PEU1_9CHLR|nr:protein of unknown function [Candidatus Promineifilum breve]